MPPVRQELDLKPQCFSPGVRLTTVILRAILRFALWFGRFEVKGTERLPRSGPLVVVSNHISVLDPLFMFAALPNRPFAFLAMTELWKLPVIGRFVNFIGMIPVDRANRVSKARAMQYGAAVLGAGGLVVVYPQGHLEPHGWIETWETGAFRMKAPVVPVGISGSDKLRRGKPARVRISFGTALRPEDFASEADFAAAAKQQVDFLSRFPNR